VGQTLLPGLDVVVIARAKAVELGGVAAFAELSRVAKSIQ
jgi:RNase P protein component